MYTLELRIPDGIKPSCKTYRNIVHKKTQKYFKKLVIKLK